MIKIVRFIFNLFRACFTMCSVSILIARSESEKQEAFDLLRNSKALGCDTETSGLNPKKSELFSIQFSDSKLNVLIPISEGISPGPLAKILIDPKIVKIFHNARFDLAFLEANNLFTENVFDTMIAERVLTKGAGQSASLAETLYRYYAIDLDKSQRQKFGRNWDRVWTDELVKYALDDVEYLPRLMKEQSVWLKDLGLQAEYQAQMESILGAFGNH